MGVALVRLKRADQLTLLKLIAVLRVDMPAYRSVAFFRVNMLLSLRQRADQISLRIKAVIVVAVHHIVNISADQGTVSTVAVVCVPVYVEIFRRADQLTRPLRDGHFITFIRMYMFLLTADHLFCGDGGQDQGISGAEHHHAGQDAHNLQPKAAAALPDKIAVRLGLYCFLHSGVPLSIPQHPACSKARYGR